MKDRPVMQGKDKAGKRFVKYESEVKAEVQKKPEKKAEKTSDK